MAQTQHDISRMLHNQQNLLEVMPEMVLLLHDGNTIEYMNPSAMKFFGDLHKRSLSELSGSPGEPMGHLIGSIHHLIEQNSIGVQQEIKVRDRILEFVLAPFDSDKGELLHWLFLREKSEHDADDHLGQLDASLPFDLLEGEPEIFDSIANRAGRPEMNSLNASPDLLAEEGTMIGSSRALGDLRDMVKQVAKSDATILITGESGTGKELVANLIKETSERADKPFLKINCNTINDSILESDLFGYEKGAFTGADSRRQGKFEVVDGGTIFLDEIGDISPRMQAALLRVLQDGEIIRVGGNQPIQVDVRVVAATNVDLAKAVQDGTFRLDLYYRLNIINIMIPPLRERKEDIVDLVSFFVRRYREAFNKDITFLPQSVMDRLIAHQWPGNVRELENVIQRAVLMTKNNVITESQLYFDLPAEEKIETVTESYLKRYEGLSLKNILAELEKEIVLHTLKRTRGNVAASAQRLHVGKTAFYDKMKRYGISAKEYK